MFNNQTMSIQNLENFNFEETKKNVKNYFMTLEKLEWELAKLNAQRGLATNSNLTTESKKQAFSPIGKDTFSISSNEKLAKQVRAYLARYYSAKNLLSGIEKLYIIECFVNHKYEDEIISLLGFSSNDSREFRKLKKSAIYKFADFLDLVVEKGK